MPWTIPSTDSPPAALSPGAVRPTRSQREQFCERENPGRGWIIPGSEKNATPPQRLTNFWRKNWPRKWRFFAKNDHFWPKNHIIFLVNLCGGMQIFLDSVKKIGTEFYFPSTTKFSVLEPFFLNLKSSISPRGTRARAFSSELADLPIKMCHLFQEKNHTFELFFENPPKTIILCGVLSKKS